MSTWLIRWTDKSGEPASRMMPRTTSGGPDVFDACRLVSRIYGPVYFTPLDDHGRPVRTNDHGQALWTCVTADSHEIDVLLAWAQR